VSVQLAKLKFHINNKPGGIDVILDTPIILQVPGAAHTVAEQIAGGTVAGIRTMGPGDATPLQHRVNCTLYAVYVQLLIATDGQAVAQGRAAAVV
jgi:hypothetical protein